jgi:hypothetical protein
MESPARLTSPKFGPVGAAGPFRLTP